METRKKINKIEELKEASLEAMKILDLKDIGGGPHKAVDSIKA